MVIWCLISSVQRTLHGESPDSAVASTGTAHPASWQAASSSCQHAWMALSQLPTLVRFTLVDHWTSGVQVLLVVFVVVAEVVAHVWRVQVMTQGGGHTPTGPS